MVNALESGHSGIEDARRRVTVVQAGALEQPLYKVRAVEISSIDLLAHAHQKLRGRERGQRADGLIKFRDEFGENGTLLRDEVARCADDENKQEREPEL